MDRGFRQNHRSAVVISRAEPLGPTRKGKHAAVLRGEPVPIAVWHSFDGDYWAVQPAVLALQESPERTIKVGVAEGEHATPRTHEPVPAAVGAGRCRCDGASEAAVQLVHEANDGTIEVGSPIGEDATVRADEPVPAVAWYPDGGDDGRAELPEPGQDQAASVQPTACHLAEQLDPDHGVLVGSNADHCS